MAGEILEGYTVLGFDLETTGISTRGDRIIQFAFIGADERGDPIEFTKLVNPKRPIPEQSTRVHGILDADVEGEREFTDYLDKLDEIIGGSILVGHNIRAFDWPFLEAEYLRAGRIPAAPKAILDTLLIARSMQIPGRHRLGDLCMFFSINLARAHDACADAAATLLLLWKLMESEPNKFRTTLDELENWKKGDQSKENDLLGPSLDDLETIDPEGKLRLDENGNIILAFGRYKGRSLIEVKRIDRAYVGWIQSPASGFSDDDINKIKSHLSMII